MAGGYAGIVRGPLGRREPADFVHVERYGIAQVPLEKPTPVVMGTMWPVEADRPEKDSRGSWWIGRRGWSGRSRGGHAYALEPENGRDSENNYTWHNQISEGICVSEGVVRAAALLFRRRFQPRPLYDGAQAIDEWADTPPEEGTSVRAGFDVWRRDGLVAARRGEDHWESSTDVDREPRPDPSTRLVENRWATNAQQVLDALGTPELDYVVLLNSWGRLSPDGRYGYPHRTRMPAEALQWLLDRNGEAGIPVFR